MNAGRNTLVAVVRTTYGYEDLGNITFINHKSCEQLPSDYFSGQNIGTIASTTSNMTKVRPPPALMKSAKRYLPGP